MNKYLSSQFNPLPNDSKFPENQMYITETKILSFDFDVKINKTIKVLDINKVYGYLLEFQVTC